MKISIKQLMITALMLGLGLILPSFFHMLGAGPVMLPMHIPVLICGLMCGAPYGALCGAILPFLSSALTGMPPMFPTALSMALELATYGLVTGLLYRRWAWNIYAAMLLSMLAGRVVSGLANAVLLGLSGGTYTVQAFLTAAFVTSIPGIVIQLLFVPVIVLALTKAQLVEKPKKSSKTA